MSPQRARSGLPLHWPLTALVVGLPAWWLLGVLSFVPIAAAAVMAVQLRRLARTRPLLVPRGFALWVLFLVWVLLGVTVLWADAPGAVPGGGAARLLVFGYRLAWYLTCTVVLVWIVNIGRDVLSDERVRRLLGGLFVIATVGGLLALAVPDLAFPSALELVLPRGLRSNSFVASLVHVEAADVQLVLGRPETRPKAPFAFTNTWGACLSLGLIFFVAGLLRARRVSQVAGALVVVAALAPIVYSLNRGLWVSLGIGVAGLVVLILLRRPQVLLPVAIAVAVGVVGVALSPLGDLYQERLDNQHSNERRGQLLDATVASVSAGSPVVGFGNTRDVQGSFASISGGATPTCPACGVPPLGTQGQLWLVLFSQGWLGLAFFLVFVLLALSRSWRCRTLNEAVCTFAVVFFLVQLPVYDTLGLPLLMVMASIGLVTREQLARARPLAALVPDRRRVLMTTGLAAGGAVIGWQFAAGGSSVWASTVAVELRPPETTIDTEAALLVSESALTRAAPRAGSSAEELRRSVSISAHPLTSVLEVTIVGPDPTTSDEGVRAVADSYLIERQEFLNPLQPDVGQVIRVGTAVERRPQVAVPATSGLALGLVVGAGLCARPDRPRRPRRRS